MTPLAVTARLRGAIALPGGPMALDSLLANRKALRDGLPPPLCAEACVPIPIPIAVEPGGRFHLASFSVSETECREKRWVIRAFPLAEAMVLGSPDIHRVRIGAGAERSYQLPLETQHLRDDTLRWWCIGDAEPIRELLALARFLGKKRGSGFGPVERWDVEPCEPWPGFPVVRDGRALRPLPVDWPGLAPNAELGYRVVGIVDGWPYWGRSREALCAVPEGAA